MCMARVLWVMGCGAGDGWCGFRVLRTWPLLSLADRSLTVAEQAKEKFDAMVQSHAEEHIAAMEEALPLPNPSPRELLLRPGCVSKAADLGDD